MLEKGYSRLLEAVSKDEVFLIARALGKSVKRFVDEQKIGIEPSKDKPDIEIRLEAFFRAVCEATGEEYREGSDFVNEFRLDNWAKGKSPTLAIATYFYMSVTPNAQPIIYQINKAVFGVRTLKAPKSLLIPSIEAAEAQFLDHLSNGHRGAIFSDEGVSHAPIMARIRSGEFLIGSPQREHDRDSFESPRYEVVIPEDFAISVFAITRGQYAEFVKAKRHPKGPMYVWKELDGWELREDRDWRNPGFEQTDSHPVVGVSLEDAVRYCDWLSMETGQIYRLPTEEEWEYACRAESGKAFSWGDDIGPTLANYDHREAYLQNGKTSDFIGTTVSVDEYEPNKWGLYQMHGNVWEWCSNPWIDNYRSRAAGKESNYPRDFNRAVVRGGSWLSIPNKLRAAKRDWDGRDLRGDTVGFRVVREIHE